MRPPARGIPKHNLWVVSYVPGYVGIVNWCSPDGMYFVLEIWHSVSTFDELLDNFEIVFLAVFEALTIVEDEMFVVGRDYFVIDIRYACLAVCYVLFYELMRWKIRNGEVS
jgi:hypothetical protein